MFDFLCSGRLDRESEVVMSMLLKLLDIIGVLTFVLAILTLGSGAGTSGEYGETIVEAYSYTVIVNILTVSVSIVLLFVVGKWTVLGIAGRANILAAWSMLLSMWVMSLYIGEEAEIYSTWIYLCSAIASLIFLGMIVTELGDWLRSHYTKKLPE